MAYEFGNDPKKTERYVRFWNRVPVNRPLIGFTTLTWFPLDEYSASAAWPKNAPLTPDMIEPEAFMDEQEEKLREGEIMDDDMIRGANPSMAVFWCCGTLGCGMRVLPGNVVAVDQSLPWDQVLGMKIDLDNPWFVKYLEFIDTLVARSDGRYPVSHGTLVGPLDYAVALRGHEQTVIDMVEEPENAARFLREMGEAFIRFTDEAWKHIPPWHGGGYDAQYRIWAPGTMARMQEDAIAVMSPDLYREFIYPVDKTIAGHYQNPFMHLHATSMIVLDQLLTIDGIKAFEINHDVGGPELTWLLPYLQMVQKAGKPLVVRGEFSQDELKLLADNLDPAGLFLHIMVKDVKETEPLRPLVGL